MAKRVKSGLDLVDSWTNNGYGMTIKPPKKKSTTKTTTSKGKKK